MKMFLWMLICCSLFTRQATAHDIYVGLTDRNGHLCCGEDDCFATEYREDGDRFWLKTKEKDDWVEISRKDIIFLPIPGDADETGPAHRAHLCYRNILSGDTPSYISNAFTQTTRHNLIHIFCAFIPPGAY